MTTFVVMLVLAIIAYVRFYGPEVLLHAIVALYAIVCLPVIGSMPCIAAIIVECAIGAAVVASILVLENVRDSHCL